jgi:hypothetical protein
MFDLIINIAFLKQWIVFTILKAADLNKSVQGGELYRAIRFGEGSLVEVSTGGPTDFDGLYENDNERTKKRNRKYRLKNFFIYHLKLSKKYLRPYQHYITCNLLMNKII